MAEQQGDKILITTVQFYTRSFPAWPSRLLSTTKKWNLFHLTGSGTAYFLLGCAHSEPVANIILQVPPTVAPLQPRKFVMQPNRGSFSNATSNDSSFAGRFAPDSTVAERRRVTVILQEQVGGKSQ